MFGGRCAPVGQRKANIEPAANLPVDLLRDKRSALLTQNLTRDLAGSFSNVVCFAISGPEMFSSEA
jgi:hypothetical protein